MSKVITKLKPEAIKPGLNVLVDWNGSFEKAKVIRKLRKNWLVRIPDRDISHAGGVDGKYSIPPERLTLDIVFNKEGRALLATPEDQKYFFSKEHIDYCKSLCVEDPGKIVNEKGVRV